MKISPYNRKLLISEFILSGFLCNNPEAAVISSIGYENLWCTHVSYWTNSEHIFLLIIHVASIHLCPIQQVVNQQHRLGISVVKTDGKGAATIDALKNINKILYSKIRFQGTHRVHENVFLITGFPYKRIVN